MPFGSSTLLSKRLNESEKEGNYWRAVLSISGFILKINTVNGSHLQFILICSRAHCYTVHLTLSSCLYEDPRGFYYQTTQIIDFLFYFNFVCLGF